MLPINYRIRICLQRTVHLDPSHNPHWRPHDEHRNNGGPIIKSACPSNFAEDLYGCSEKPRDTIYGRSKPSRYNLWGRAVNEELQVATPVATFWIGYRGRPRVHRPPTSQIPEYAGPAQDHHRPRICSTCSPKRRQSVVPEGVRVKLLRRLTALQRYRRRKNERTLSIAGFFIRRGAAAAAWETAPTLSPMWIAFMV